MAMKLSYIIQVFSTDRLASTQGVDDALTYVRTHFVQEAANYPGVQKLLSTLVSNQCPAGLFEFIVANDGEVCRIIRQHLSSQLSQASAEEASTVNLVAHHLVSFFKMASASGIHLPKELLKVEAELATLDSALNGLSSIGHLVLTTTEQLTKDDDRKPRQKGHKSGSLSKSVVARDKLYVQWEDTFSQIGERFPRTAEEVDNVRQRILLRTQRIVIVYLNVLSASGMQSFATSSYLKGAHRLSAHAESLDHGVKTTAPNRRACFTYDGREDPIWHIEMSSRALQNLYGLDGAKFSVVEEKIRELSEGILSGHNQTHVAGVEGEIEVYKAPTTANLWLVYQVQCGPIFTSSGYLSDFDVQQLRILAICDHDPPEHPVWAAVASQSKKRHPDYRQRCKILANKRKGQSVVYPEGFPRNPKLAEAPGSFSAEAKLSSKDFVELHEILSLAKFIPYSRSLLKAAQLSDGVQHPFSTSERENQVICHPSSCVVVGRSGTGKTTTMMFRMLDRELEARERSQNIRQVFVTQSPHLAARVKDYFHKLLQSFAAPSSTLSGQIVLDPLFDAVNEEADERPGLPGHFSGLEENHFPLFLAYDELRNLLEKEFEIRSSAEGSLPQPRFPLSRVARFSHEKDYVTYDYFLVSMWPHFKAHLTWKLDPALVFNEFMGVIMGSEASLETVKGYLSREEYENLSWRKGTFAFARSRIYDLFEAYLKAKNQAGALDSPRRTRSILDKIDSLTTNTLPLFDFLYVDEVQDNTIIDAQLLRKMCRNPHGQVWCGDTAQTIAAGSSFRFEDLKAYLYRAERNEALVTHKLRAPIDPELFQLSINYRSHGGIVNVAAEIVSIISKLFPQSIDSLEPEKGVVAGPKPVFDQGLDFKEFFSRSSRSGSNRDRDSTWEKGEMLGANQAILVRSESTKQSLPRILGQDPGLIFTIYDSKGLEFNDVIIYNFFTDSDSSAKDWASARQILDDVNRGVVSPYGHDAGVRLASIQTELKCLYVALTRARKQVWIWESSEDGNPLRDWAEVSELINRRSDFSESDEPTVFVPHASKTSDWFKQGVSLFKSEKFQHAAACFTRAGCWEERNIALAYDLRRAASSLSRNNANRKVEMIRTGESLRNCAEECSSSQRKKHLHLQAAEAFLEAPEFFPAGKQFYLAQEYENAAMSYRRAGSFDEAISVIETQRQHISETTAENIIELAKVDYARSAQIKKCRKLFTSDDDQLQFLDDLGFHDQQLKVIEESSRIDRCEEMAKVCFDKGDTLSGIKHLLSSQKQASRKQAASMLWDMVWDELPLGRTFSESDLTEILNMLKSAPLTDLQAMHLNLVDVLIIGDDRALLDMAHAFSNRGDSRAAFLAFDSVLQNAHEHMLKDTSGEDVCGLLRHLLVYARLIRQIVLKPTFIQDRHSQSLLGLSQVAPSISQDLQSTNSDLRVLPHSILLRDLQHQPTEPPDAANDKSQSPGIMMDRQILIEGVRKTLLRRLNSILWKVHLHALQSRAFRVCFHFAMFGRCRRDNDCRRQHISIRQGPGGFDLGSYNFRVRLHLQLILALDHLVVVDGSEAGEDGKNRGTVQRIWLERLFETLNPASFHFGSLVNVRPGLIPEHIEGMSVVRSWVQERFLPLSHPPPGHTKPWPFMSEIMAVSTLAFQLDPQNAANYFRQGEWGKWSELDKSLRVPVMFANGAIKPIIESVFVWMSHAHPRSLESSASFIRHVIHENLEIDLNAFTHLTEMVTAHIIMSTSSLDDGTLVPRNRLSGTMLPRSPLLRTLQRPPGLVDMHNVRELVRALGDFIARLGLHPSSGGYTMLTSPKYDRRTRNAIAGAGFQEKSVIMSRVCRCLVLFGHNFNSYRWKGFIMNILSFRTLPLEGDDLALFHTSLVRPYVTAARQRNWVGIFSFLKHSMFNSPLDELVVIYDRTHLNPSALYRVRRIIYANIEDLENQLRQDALIETTAETLQPREDANLPTEETSSSEAPNVDTLPDDPSFAVASPAEQPAPVDSRDDFAIQNTDKQVEACRRIQKAFRRSRRYAVSARKAPRTYEDYLAAFMEIQGRLPRRYNLRFLGPLPHALAFVERLTKGLVNKKQSTNKALNNVAHEELDALLERQKSLTRLIDQARRVHQNLHPRSPMHVTCTIRKLRDAIQEVVHLRESSEALLGRMGPDGDYSTGVETLLRDTARQSLRSPLKTKRPSLNRADLY